MTKKRVVFLIVIVLLTTVYFKLFYKTYSIKSVPKSADCIIAIDVKRITNTLIWQFITTPSQWKTFSISSSKSKEINWKDIIKIPDFLFVFHINNQSNKNWYAVLDIKDEDAFNKGIIQYHFKNVENNTNNTLFFSKELGISLIKNKNQILISNVNDDEQELITNIANELFNKNDFVTPNFLQKTIDAKSHLSIAYSKNSVLQEDVIVKANFDKNNITVQAFIKPKNEFVFTENEFSYASNSLCTLAFGQPSTNLYNIVNDTIKSNISNSLNVDIDVFLKLKKATYNLDMAAILPRIDSAVSYKYDDNFNAVENVVVNKVDEPSFNFSIKADSISPVFNYFVTNKKIEANGTSNIFIPMPFVKSYCYKKNENELNITSNNYNLTKSDKIFKGILYFKFLISALPQKMVNYLPDYIKNSISNIELITAYAQNENNFVVFNLRVTKKNNELPIIKL